MAALPADFPPWSTVYNFFAGWQADGVVADVLGILRQRVRLADGRAATSTAAVIDSQSRLRCRQEDQRPVNGTSPWTRWAC
jgi:transposase